MPRVPSRPSGITLRLRNPANVSKAKLPFRPSSSVRDDNVNESGSNHGTSHSKKGDAEGKGKSDSSVSQDVGEDEDHEDLSEDESPASDSEDEWVPESIKGRNAKDEGKRGGIWTRLSREGDSETSGEEFVSHTAEFSDKGDEDGFAQSKPHPPKVTSEQAKRKNTGKSKGSEVPLQKRRRTTRAGSVYSDADDDPELAPIVPNYKAPAEGETSLGKLKGSNDSRGNNPLQMSEPERGVKKMKAERKRQARRQEAQDAKEIREAQHAADAAWQAVRAKKAAASDAQGNAKKSSDTPSFFGADGMGADARVKGLAQEGGKGEDKAHGAHTLSSWLGLAPKTSDLPMPTSCASAQLADRDSLFIAYVYPLESNSPHVLSAMLTHLSKVVHPTHVPVDLLPPNLRGAPAEKRGSSHDMYALRVLQLKPGRSGTGGPEDFAITEDKEDDGEKWGSQHILRIMQEEGAVDCLCVVSRWYGGVLLGPDRFKHIASVARAALQQYQLDETLKPLIEQLRQLDNEIVLLKCELSGMGAIASSQSNKNAPPNYEDNMSVEKAERLLNARRKQIEISQRMIARKREEKHPHDSPVHAAPTSSDPSAQ
ncbi:hypothetical protein K437DRAFT_274460 [Tilletiaria anomala UBC 951]|uniref:Impact N-terminal domain-containing protein n=1 Tax=Tilletiaria anomala (strain ATCC 24038 / CBS 436.72 / UBC 951) TaxID=1037660 RepID=A0A066W112_TILAU|nr:uncharacterized protein K437DRAFT_274460 [Tilletiaria anomala UBC 951]KDN44754.1 hypothetical protein K437DRAFT_274460 [Tilletiaria anomala UBC 951]